tara:strand:- start:190 stop:1239 length:1050 start_codon:yes stop_codon:yes gene_type:complete
MLGITMIALLSIYLTIDFVEQVRKYLKADTQLIDIITYLGLKFPGIIYQLTPLAVLLATLITLGGLSYDNEITAMRASGINLWRITASFLLLPFTLSLLLLTADRSLIPTTNEQAHHVRTTILEHHPKQSLFTQNRIWLRISANTFMNVQLVDLSQSTLFGVSLYQLNQNFVLQEMIDAQELRYDDEQWHLISGIKRRFLDDRKIETILFSQEQYDLQDKPFELQKRLTVKPSNLTLPELASYIGRLEKNGYPASKYAADYYGRYAFPFASLVMAILGISITLLELGTRRKHFARSIGYTLFIGFHYWIIHSFAIGIGRGNVMPPILSGWTANIIFLAVGVFLISRIRQ